MFLTPGMVRIVTKEGRVFYGQIRIDQMKPPLQPDQDWITDEVNNEYRVG